MTDAVKETEKLVINLNGLRVGLESERPVTIFRCQLGACNPEEAMLPQFEVAQVNNAVKVKNLSNKPMYCKVLLEPSKEITLGNSDRIYNNDNTEIASILKVSTWDEDPWEELSWS